mmetsp:Transcript_65793/g.169343  ORF Transcript_65793/g.169343 Transcript_65793/m.169343 type:complete len:289 (-) Transcript_65793:152-1018(-)
MHLHELADERLGLGGAHSPPCELFEGEHSLADLLCDLVLVGAGEGRAAAQHCVHDSAATPHVALPAVWALLHLRGSVLRRPDHGVHNGAVGRAARGVKVDELQHVALDAALALEQEVLRLEVAMHDVLLVHVEDGTKDVLDQGCSLGLAEVAHLHDLIEKLTTLAQLHDKEDVVPVLEGLEESDDVRVIHHLHHRDLLPQTLEVPHVRLGDLLDGPQHACGPVLAEDDATVGALAQLLPVHLIHLAHLRAVLQDELRCADGVGFPDCAATLRRIPRLARRLPSHHGQL